MLKLRFKYYFKTEFSLILDILVDFSNDLNSVDMGKRDMRKRRSEHSSRRVGDMKVI
jgi:hypothetical protein